MAEKKLKNTLQQMPDIKPLTEKEELFQTITVKKDRQPRKRSKKLFIVPVFSTLFVLTLVFLFVNNGQYSMLKDQASETADNEFSNMQESMSQDSGAIEKNELKSADGDNTNQLVVQKLNNNEKIAYAEITDKQEGYVIPVSYVLPENNSKEFDESEINLFQNKLSQIFSSEQYQKKIYKKKSVGSSTEKESYKIYKHASGTRELLIPVKLGNKTDIKDALQEMKKHEAGSAVISSIPKNVSFEINESETIVQLTVLEESTLVNDFNHQQMIEAILMTAKSYGYEEVTFISNTLDKIGPYQLNEPIPVPIAINPINSVHY